MTLYQLGDVALNIDANVHMTPEATVISRVELKAHVNVWPGAAIRGDNEPVTVDEASSVQEGSVLHTDPDCPSSIGDHVTIGHQVMLHGCTISGGSLTGIQTVVLNRVVISRNCPVDAGAVVAEGKVSEDDTPTLGAPVKAVRRLTEDDIARMHLNTETYAVCQAMYK